MFKTEVNAPRELNLEELAMVAGGGDGSVAISPVNLGGLVAINKSIIKIPPCDPLKDVVGGVIVVQP